MCVDFGLTLSDCAAAWTTLQLASLSTLILLLLGLPLALWLAHSRCVWKVVIEALVALPLVLPPTVLGFYLLLVFSPHLALGQWLNSLGLPSLAFSFEGLVLASVIYSLPFVVQPLQNTFVSLGKAPLEAAACLGMPPWKSFIWVMLPLCRYGILSAATLGFAHTLGEFGVVLMIGGNIPGETQVLSIAIYEHVESLNYGMANKLSLLLIVSSMSLLLFIYWVNRRVKLKIL